MDGKRGHFSPGRSDKAKRGRSGDDGGVPLPSLKLTYFPYRGRAETTRLLFALGSIPYEDERVTVVHCPGGALWVTACRFPLNSGTSSFSTPFPPPSHSENSPC